MLWLVAFEIMRPHFTIRNYPCLFSWKGEDYAKLGSPTRRPQKGAKECVEQAREGFSANRNGARAVTAVADNNWLMEDVQGVDTTGT